MLDREFGTTDLYVVVCFVSVSSFPMQSVAIMILSVVSMLAYDTRVSICLFPAHNDHSQVRRSCDIGESREPHY